VQNILKSAVCLLFLCLSATPQKQLKTGESGIFTEVTKDLNASSFTKAITDLDSWLRKFPDSDYQDDRTALYVQAYAGANQPEKALEAAAALLSKDLNTTFAGSGAEATIIRVLYNAVMAVSKAKNPTPSELATGSKAASLILTFDKPIPGVPGAQWIEIQNDLRAKASATLLYIAMLPGMQAMAKQPPDCAVANTAYTDALKAHPESAAISYELGRALNCEAKTNPEKENAAIYEFVRAATLDPTLGDSRNDPKKIEAFAESSYARRHGSTEGLDQLRLAVKQSPLPPDGFQIETADQIAQEKQDVFEKEHPQLALWMKIKAALTGANGDQYFETQLKDAAVPQLTGTIVEATPACRSKQLMIAASQPAGPAEIVLKLDKPLAGRPEVNSIIQFDAVPAAFTKEPFLLTMDVETNKVAGLKITPCSKR